MTGDTGAETGAVPAGLTPAGPRTLVLLRHAKSSWAEPGLADADRPLNERGRRDAAAVGRWFEAGVGTPDLVLCSTALRTRQTWEGARSAAAVLAGAPVRLEEAVYEAWSDTLLDLVRGLPADVGTAVVVGHSPGVPDLAERLNRTSGTGPVGEFPTGALGVFEVDGPWEGLGPGTARLTAYAVPRG